MDGKLKAGDSLLSHRQAGVYSREGLGLAETMEKEAETSGCLGATLKKGIMGGGLAGIEVDG